VVCAASLETATTGQWVCEHRDPSIRNMVRFRRIVAGSNQGNWWDDGGNAIAFSRGNKGFVAINNGTAPVKATLATGMPAGRYCDRLAGGLLGNGCAGSGVVVDAAGMVQLTLQPRSAIVIDAETLR
jgi:alpha-amylase